MALYLRDTALRFRKSNIEYDRAALNGFSVDKGLMSPYNVRSNNSLNPWQIPTEHGNEDITWLI